MSPVRTDKLRVDIPLHQGGCLKLSKVWHGAGDLSIADKFLDDNSENLYGEPHPSRMGVRHARRIVVKVCAPAGPPTSQQGGAAAATASGLYSALCPHQNVQQCQTANTLRYTTGSAA